MDEDILRKLAERLGPLHAKQRLGIETDHEAQIFGQGLILFHIGNWYPVHSVIRNTLKLTGLYWRGRRNTERILVKLNDVMFRELPPLFDGFTILHISDMHVDMNEGAMRRLIELIGGMRYDLCVLTGDTGALYRTRDRRILVKGSMSPDAVVVMSVRFQNPAEMCLAQNDDVIQTLTPDRSDQPFGKTILPR
jgi:hypothetical protein